MLNPVSSDHCDAVSYSPTGSCPANNPFRNQYDLCSNYRRSQKIRPMT
nr:MAG TPA: hypothetical protein [Caudoviricetes sp.]